MRCMTTPTTKITSSLAVICGSGEGIKEGNNECFVVCLLYISDIKIYFQHICIYIFFIKVFYAARFSDKARSVFFIIIL